MRSELTDDDEYSYSSSSRVPLLGKGSSPLHRGSGSRAHTGPSQRAPPLTFFLAFRALVSTDDFALMIPSKSK